MGFGLCALGCVLLGFMGWAVSFGSDVGVLLFALGFVCVCVAVFRLLCIWRAPSRRKIEGKARKADGRPRETWRFLVLSGESFGIGAGIGFGFYGCRWALVLGLGFVLELDFKARVLRFGVHPCLFFPCARLGSFELAWARLTSFGLL